MEEKRNKPDYAASPPVIYIKDLLVKFADKNISNQTLLPCYYAKVC
jgi:hypothetical protein